MCRMVVVIVGVSIFLPGDFTNANPILLSIPDNTALDLGAYRCEEFETLIQYEQTAQCGTITDYSGMVYDPVFHRMLVWGGGHAATYRDDVEMLDLEDTSFQWRSDAPPTPCSDMVIENVDLTLSRWITTNHPISRHSYDLLVVVPQQRALWMMAAMQGRGRGCNHLPPVSEDAPYVLGDGPMARYDFDTKEWTFYPELGRYTFQSGTAYDPVSGYVVIVNGNGFSVFDPEGGQYVIKQNWPQSLKKEIDSGVGVELVYVPPRDSFFVMVTHPRTDVAGGVWEVSPDRQDWSSTTIRKLDVPLPEPRPKQEAWAWDSANGLIVGAVSDGLVYAFDPAQEQWHVRQAVVQSDEVDSLGTVAAHALAYDPRNGVIIFRTGHPNRRTWAYRWGGEPNLEPTEEEPVGEESQQQLDGQDGGIVEQDGGQSSDSEDMPEDDSSELESGEDTDKSEDTGTNPAGKITGECGCGQDGGSAWLSESWFLFVLLFCFGRLLNNRRREY